jgi:hypothetical protein
MLKTTTGEDTVSERKPQKTLNLLNIHGRILTEGSPVMLDIKQRSGKTNEVSSKTKNSNCVTSKEFLFGKIKGMENIKIYQTTLTMPEVIKSTVALFFSDNDKEYKRLSQQ